MRSSLPLEVEEPIEAASSRRRLPRLRPWVLVGLVVVTSYGLGLRWIGLDYLLPHFLEGDSLIVYQTRVLQERGSWTGSTLGVSNDYPTLIARCASMLPAPPPAGSVDEPAELAEHLRVASAEFLGVRLTVCLFAALLVPATFFLVRRLLGARAALIAAALIAVDPLHLLFSGQARPHGVLASLTLLGVLALVRLRAWPTRANYVLAGVVTALALGALHSGIALLIPLAVAHWTRERRAGPAPHSRILFALAPIVLGTAYFYREIFIELGRFEPAVQSGAIVQGGHKVALSMFDGTGFAQVSEILFGMNPVLAVLALIGGALLIRQGVTAGLRSSSPAAADARVVLAYALPYFLMIGIYGRTFERFLVPILPYFALLASFALVRGVTLLAKPAGGSARVVWVTCLLLAFAFPAYTSGKLAWLRTQPDTYDQAAALVADLLLPDEVALLGPDVHLPIFYNRRFLTDEGRTCSMWGNWPRYQYRAPHRMGRELRFRALPYLHVRAAYHSSETAHRMIVAHPAPALTVIEILGAERSPTEQHRLLDAVDAWGLEVARVRPDRAEETPDRRLTYSYGSGFLQRLLTAGALGTELRIYRHRSLATKSSD